MPNTASAKKRLRQNVVRRDRNRSVKSAVRTEMKRVLSLAAEGNAEKAEESFKEAAKRLDRAASANVMHRNTAARYKARLQRAIKRAKTPAS